MEYLEDVEKEAFEGVAVEGLQGPLKDRIPVKLIALVFDGDLLWFFPVELANFNVLDLAAGPNLSDFQAHDLVLLAPALLNVTLLHFLFSLVSLGADQAAEDLIGGLEGVVHSFVVDADGGVEQFAGEFPEAKPSGFGEFRVDDFDWYLERISWSNFLYKINGTPLLANSSRS